jgi:hypothetical protein
MDEVLASAMVRDTNVNRSNEEYVEMVDAQFPARHTFEVTSVPQGEAPFKIREQWVGTRLPVRTELVKYQSISVLAVDGLVALKRAERQEAHDWWQDYYEHANGQISIPRILNPFARQPGMLARISFLGFEPSEGNLTETPRNRR